MFSTGLELCQQSYSSGPYVNYLAKSHSCADYFSGFYNAPHPDMDIVNMRSPRDIEKAVELIEKNTLMSPLNRSNYKLKAERDLFRNAVSDLDNITIDNILAFSNAADLTKDINNKDVVIWKALNYYGYDVPPEWFDRLELASESEYREFNQIVKELAGVTNWADNAVKLLTGSADLEKFKMELLTDDLYLEKKVDLDNHIIGGYEPSLILWILIAVSVLLITVLIYLILVETKKLFSKRLILYSKI